MTITITGNIDEKLNDEECMKLVSVLMQLGISEINIQEAENDK